MKLFSCKEQPLQISIITICGVILTFYFSLDYSKAQTSCLPDRPPFTDPTNPQGRAWHQFTSNISIVVFDRSASEPTSVEEFNAIVNSIRDWNSVAVSGCSNVTFGNSTLAGRVWNGVELPPDNTVYVIRSTTNRGQWIGRFTTSGMIAGRIILNSNNYINAPLPSNRLDNIAKHEAGHSYGLGNGSYANDPPSIYAENSFGPSGNFIIT
jgi:hypothetical protein